MYFPKTWAKAFINSLEREDTDIEEGIQALIFLADKVKALPGIVSGRIASKRLQELLHEETVTADPEAVSSGLKIAVRFIILLVRKNMLRHINPVMKEIRKLVNEKHGIVEVSLEYVSPLENESRIMESIKKRSGATKVIINSRQNPKLIGGYKLRIGDEIIDASVRSQLDILKNTLQNAQLSGDGGY